MTAAAVSGCIPAPDHIGASHDLAEQAHIAFKQGNLERAQKLYLEAESEARQSDSPRQLPHVLCALGQVYAQEGDAKSAQSCLEQSLKMYNDLLAKNSDEEEAKSLTERKVATLVALANVFRDHAQWQEAEITYKQALDASSSLQRFNYDEVSVEYENMMRKKGEPQAAIALARTTLDRTGENQRWSKDFQSAIKNWSYYTGRPDQQRESAGVLDHLHAFAVRLGPTDPRWAASYDFLVNRQRISGQFAAAEKNCQLAIKKSDENQNVVPLTTRLTLRGQMANIYMHQGRLPDALATINHAIALAQPIISNPQLIAPPYPSVISNLYAEQAIILQKLNKPQEAQVAQQHEDNIRKNFQDWRAILNSSQQLYSEQLLREHMFEVAIERASIKQNRQGVGCVKSAWASHMLLSERAKQAEKLATESLDDLKGVDAARFCLARSYLLLAVINKQRKQNEQAAQFYQQAIATAGTDHWIGNTELKALITLYHSN